MYKVFMQLRIQICSNDVLSVYSSAITNSSERSGRTEGLEIQDWYLQYSIIVTICTWKCLNFYHIEESLYHIHVTCNAGNFLLVDGRAALQWEKFLPRQPNKPTHLLASVAWRWAPTSSPQEVCSSFKLTAFETLLVPFPLETGIPHKPHQ